MGQAKCLLAAFSPSEQYAYSLLQERPRERVETEEERDRKKENIRRSRELLQRLRGGGECESAAM